MGSVISTTFPDLKVDEFGEQDLLRVLLKTRMPPPGKMVPEEQQGCLQSIPFSCFCHGSADVRRRALHERAKGSLYMEN